MGLFEKISGAISRYTMSENDRQKAIQMGVEQKAVDATCGIQLEEGEQFLGAFDPLTQTSDYNRMMRLLHKKDSHMRLVTNPQGQEVFIRTPSK